MASQEVRWDPPIPWYHHAIAWGLPLVLVALAFLLPALLGMRGHEMPRCAGWLHDLQECPDR